VANAQSTMLEMLSRKFVGPPTASLVLMDDRLRHSDSSPVLACGIVAHLHNRNPGLHAVLRIILS
jgi:hypothetical protein